MVKSPEGPVECSYEERLVSAVGAKTFRYVVSEERAVDWPERVNGPAEAGWKKLKTTKHRIKFIMREIMRPATGKRQVKMKRVCITESLTLR